MLTPAVLNAYIDGHVRSQGSGVLGAPCEAPLVQFLNHLPETVNISRLLVENGSQGSSSSVLRKYCTTCVSPGRIGMHVHLTPTDCPVLALQRESEPDEVSVYGFRWSQGRGYYFESMGNKMKLSQASVGLQNAAPLQGSPPDRLKMRSVDVLDLRQTLKTGSFFPSPILISMDVWPAAVSEGGVVDM